MFYSFHGKCPRVDPTAFVSASAELIGDVTIGHGAIVHARYLGPEASIGMGAVLSLGCAIGAGSVVAESALVPQGKSVPPETLVAGIPAKPLRPLTQADRESWQATKDWYVRLTAAYLDPNHFFPVAPREA